MFFLFCHMHSFCKLANLMKECMIYFISFRHMGILTLPPSIPIDSSLSNTYMIMLKTWTGRNDTKKTVNKTINIIAVFFLLIFIFLSFWFSSSSFELQRSLIIRLYKIICTMRGRRNKRILFATVKIKDVLKIESYFKNFWHNYLPFTPHKNTGCQVPKKIFFNTRK